MSATRSTARLSLPAGRTGAKPPRSFGRGPLGLCSVPRRASIRVRPREPPARDESERLAGAVSAPALAGRSGRLGFTVWEWDALEAEHLGEPVASVRDCGSRSPAARRARREMKISPEADVRS